MAPMNRSAALSAAAQKLNKPQQIQGRDVTTENGQTGITGAHGGFQQLGQAAQAKLRGFGGGPTGGTRTPPIMDPATLKPGGRDPATGGVAQQGPIGYTGPNGSGVIPAGGPNVFHPTNPAAGGDLQIMDGAPGTVGPGGAPTMPFGGRTPSFGNPNQTLGVGGPQDEVQAAQHMGADIPQEAANLMRMQQTGGAGGAPPGPLGSMPGPSQKPLLRGFSGSPGIVPMPGGLPTKPMPTGFHAPPGYGMDAQPPRSSIWNRIAGGRNAGSGGLDPGNRLQAGQRTY